MQKKTIIKKIKNIMAEFGCFSIGEVEGANGICVNEMGNFVALAEEFMRDKVEVNVYEPSSFSSDSVDDYTTTYEELDKIVLEEILVLCEHYVEQQKEQEE